MGYSVKWVTENLGITRDMLRYYEKENLIPINNTRNLSNNYRDFSEKDIELIWGIKLLIGIGFSAKEIRAFSNDTNFSFYEVISNKVKQLEKKHEEILLYLEFAKTIKLTGRIPNTTQIGKMKFDDFIEYSRQNWNAFNSPLGKKLMNVTDTMLEKTTNELDENDLKQFIELFGELESDQVVYVLTSSGYYRVISDLIPLGYKNDTVQNIVKCLYEYTLKFIKPELRDKYTPLVFADQTCSSFLESGIAVLNERNYGKEGCLFIAQALAYFGGYNLDV